MPPPIGTSAGAAACGRLLTLLGGGCGVSLPGRAAVGLLLLQDHGIELAGALLELAFQDRYLLRGCDGSAAAIGSATWHAWNTAAIATAGATRAATARGAVATGVGFPGRAAGAARAAGSTAAWCAAGLARGLTHGLFRIAQHLLQAGFVIAHVGQAVAAAGVVTETGFTGTGLLTRLTTGAFLHAGFAGATALTGELPLGKLAHVALAAPRGAGGTLLLRAAC